MEIIDRGTVSAGRENTDRQSCTFPGICILPGGRWICTFRAGPRKTSRIGQTTLMCWSDDEGRTWSEPVEPFTPPAIDGRPGVFRAAYLTALTDGRVMAAICWVDYSNPELPLFNEQTEGILDMRLFVSLSEDRCATWSAPWEVALAPYSPPVAITGPVLRLNDGRLACHFELNKSYHDSSIWQHASVMKFSSDTGRTWPRHAVTGKDPEARIFYWDQRPAVLHDGRVLDLFWTYDRGDSAYLNIHASQSLDSGDTWSPVWDTGVPGQPSPAVSLLDGRTVMAYVDRTGPAAIKIRTSADYGRTWPEDTEVLLEAAQVSSQTKQKASMQDAWSEMLDFSLGLPSAAAGPAGDVLVVYYAGPRTDLTDVKWVRLRA